MVDVPIKSPLDQLEHEFAQLEDEEMRHSRELRALRKEIEALHVAIEGLKAPKPPEEPKAAGPIETARLSIMRWAVGFLGMTMLTVVVSSFVLSLNGTKAAALPDALLAVGAAAVAALAGLLSMPGSSGKS